MERYFKRKKRVVLFILIAVLLVAIFCSTLFRAIVTPDEVVLLRFLIVELVLTVISIILMIAAVTIFPPDFEYSIKRVGKYIVFVFDDTDIIKLDAIFSIVSKTPRYLVITENIEKIEIPYDGEVEEYLQEIRNQ